MNKHAARVDMCETRTFALVLDIYFHWMMDLNSFYWFISSLPFSSLKETFIFFIIVWPTCKHRFKANLKLLLIRLLFYNTCTGKWLFIKIMIELNLINFSNILVIDLHTQVLPGILNFRYCVYWGNETRLFLSNLMTDENIF